MVKQLVQSGKNALSESVNLVSIGKAIIVSYIITIPAFVIFAFILTYTNFPEKYMIPAVVITTIISILVAGSTVTRKVRSRGWLNGGMVGFIYILILFIFSSIIFNSFTIDRYVITMAVIGVLTGSIGGILGVNMKPLSYPKARDKKF